MISREEFLNLYEKHLAGLCSETEHELLFSFTDDLKLSDDMWTDPTSTADEIYNRIREKLHQSRHSQLLSKKNQSKNWLTAAAVIFFTAALHTLQQPLN